ncbi:MAG TPA: protein-glutamate O-methyltransferase CheR [Polyangiaceae bacterium]
MHSGGPIKRELDSFQGAIALRLGLRFDDSRSSLLLEVLTRRVAARGQTTRSYLAALQQGTEPCDELGELARELTVGETYFFRHADQFKALMEVALPDRLAARASSRSLRLLSAGCASGEEAYSLSILLRQQGIELDYQVTIQGLDINPDALTKATQGLYSPWSLRETPAHLTERWFVKEGRDFRLARALRDSVQFQQHNLIASSPRLMPDHCYDIVFCRNVLMYFTPGHAASIVEHLARALAPGGFLFLGHAETLRGFSHAFQLRNTHDTFYYQRRGEDGCLDESSHFSAAASAMRSRAEPTES